MACPYFMPVERLENGAWPHPSRLPLGGGWNGHCTAPGHDGEVPAQDVLEKFCNLGYADGCLRAPVSRAADAVRFAVVAPAEAGRPDSASKNTVLRLSYVCERSHRPVDHGVLEFELSTAQWLRPHDDARIQRMAQCFVESYLQKRR